MRPQKDFELASQRDLQFYVATRSVRSASYKRVADGLKLDEAFACARDVEAAEVAIFLDRADSPRYWTSRKPDTFDSAVLLAGDTSTHAAFAQQDRLHLTWPSAEYGRSLQDVSLRVWVPKGAAPTALVFAAIHGNEPETTVALSSALRATPPESLRCAVVLCANPDGTLLGLRCNGRGVDLNRNFPTQNWGPPRPGELATGDSGGSEPETKALINLIESLKPKIIMSIHADLACVDDPTPTALGKYLAQRSQLELVSDVGYPTPGSFGTWCAERQIPVVTLEIEKMGSQELRRRWGPILAEVLMGKGLSDAPPS
ncbi:MAG: murein tripeptide amidase MpaA [Myxococcaceae bacterium]